MSLAPSFLPPSVNPAEVRLPTPSSCFQDWTDPLSCPHGFYAPTSWASWWPPLDLFPCTAGLWEPRTGHSSPTAVWEVLNRGTIAFLTPAQGGVGHLQCHLSLRMPRSASAKPLHNRSVPRLRNIKSFSTHRRAVHLPWLNSVRFLSGPQFHVHCLAAFRKWKINILLFID